MPFRYLAPALFMAGSPALAQEEIVVTGRGLDEALGDEVYGSVTLERDRLTGSASNRLDEILRDVPGFQLFRRSDSRSANPTSQGATLRGLGGNASSRALLILDGVPQTDPFGGWVYWPAFDPQRLRAARVTRGGGSGVQGPGALAGTIELFSADAEDAARASAAYGSRDSLDAHALLASKLGSGFASVSGAYARGDGFIPIIESQRGAADRPSPYEQASLALRGMAPLGGLTELQANALWFHDARERGTAFTENVTDGGDLSLRLVGRGRWRWSALAYVQIRDYYNSFASVGPGRATVSRASEQVSVPSTGIGARAEVRPPLGQGVELRLGADWRSTEGVTRERFNFQNGVGTRGREAGGNSATIGAFAEAALEREGVTLTAAGRVDRWSIANGFLAERVFATGQVLTDTDFPHRNGWEPTARAGIAYRPAPELTLRSAGYLGWRLPTLNELYRPFRVGADATAAKAALTPERLRGIEAGIDYQPAPGVRIALTAFSNRLRNAIANVTLGQGPGTFPGVGFVGASGQYRRRGNLDAIDVQGVEFDARLDVGAGVSVGAGYAFTDARVRATGAAEALNGLRPAQTPRHSASATLAWTSPAGARASGTIRYIGSQYEDDLNLQLIPDALTFDLAAALPITSRLAIDLRAENLADARVVAGVSGDGVIERATPRTLWLGLRYSLRP